MESSSNSFVIEKFFANWESFFFINWDLCFAFVGNDLASFNL